MKILVYVVALFSLVAMIGCKTTEANYRAAYEITKKKATDTGDSLTTKSLVDASMPKQVIISGDTVPVITELVAITKEAGFDGAHLQKYCMVAGRFAQLFNAKSMCERLASSGYSEAFLAHNRMNQYYVIASATNNHAEVKSMLDSLKSDTTLVFRTPYPYVLRPAQLVR